jgi:hypothetical protein
MTDQLWEILVPSVANDGAKYSLDHHKFWDRQVRDISGGLTVLKPAKGHWRPPESAEYQVEEMIPVRLLCTREQIERVVDFTLEHYDQKAVLAYRISDEVILRDREDKR